MCLIDKPRYYQAPQETPALRFIQPAPPATCSLWTVGYLKRACSGQTLMLSVGSQWGSSAPPPSLQHAWELQRCLPLLGFQIRNAACSHTALISRQNLLFLSKAETKQGLNSSYHQLHCWLVPLPRQSQRPLQKIQFARIFFIILFVFANNNFSSTL